ncbi:DUF1697 domain-containing protein [uncultured Draconibacterium sp.]|uniref:DUF1697 domain-containing protein n=1 Tax=uncultured Draconibacterium sp. TaxID=1573823 RepID=UPI0025F02BB4|nr:DUF1697 domain-containing protein [uncultured Draconibacterium sp.]
MKKYIALLRGINVSGKNSIKMAQLRAMFGAAGFKSVKTYIQSGNVLFFSENDNPGELEVLIEKQIEKDFGFCVPVMVFALDDFQKTVQDNPFLSNETLDNSYLHITFLDAGFKSQQETKLSLQMQNGERYFLSEKAIYIYCPNGYGKTKLTNNYIEKVFKTRATTRNLKTVLKLLEMSAENTA